MQIATSWSTTADTREAAQAAYAQLETELGGAPDFLILYSSVLHDGQTLVDTLRSLTDAPIHGGTSCLGVMTEEGFHSAEGVGLGLCGIKDPEGNYGVGVADLGDDPRAAGAAAIQSAIELSGRVGEPPELVWLSAIPGSEEQVLLGIQDVLGGGVPIAGGSAADNTVEGNWFQFANDAVYKNAVVVTAMYPSVPTYLAFHSGYSVTDHKGQVTRAEGRTLYEIDGQPAAVVYNQWTGGIIKESLGGGNVLASTTLYPLGRVVGQVGEMPYHRLSHPDSVTSEGGLTLFADIEPGEEILLMAGTRDSLVTRAGRVAQAALDAGRITPNDISGALVVYCAGCMLTVQDNMNQVATEVRKALGQKPFMGTFTFGEQGCFIGGENRHGNLMISVVVFGK